MNWTPIKYLGFWDVPLIFIARHRGQSYLFDCPFLDDVEDYAQSYKVYLFPEVLDDQLPKDWTTLHTKAIRFLGEVPVAAVQFDPTRRQSVETGILDQLMSQKAAG